MSSPLDGRIRTLAREEAATLLGVATPSANTGTDQVAALTKEVAELRARLETLEKAAEQEARPATRRTRKAADPE